MPNHHRMKRLSIDAPPVTRVVEVPSPQSPFAMRDESTQTHTHTDGQTDGLDRFYYRDRLRGSITSTAYTGGNNLLSGLAYRYRPIQNIGQYGLYRQNLYIGYDITISVISVSVKFHRYANPAYYALASATREYGTGN